MKYLSAKIYRAFIFLFQWPRIFVYRLISQNTPILDLSNRIQPTLILGEGRVDLGRCNLGVWPSPFFFNGYIHIEARSQKALIQIGDDVWISNAAVIIAECTSISIGRGTIIGAEFAVFDSDFHELHPKRRFGGTPLSGAVVIAENVFIGARVTVLKGVSIGCNSVIGSGSVVTSSIPPNCIAAGVPARVVRDIYADDGGGA